MSISLTCNGCRKELKVKDKAAGGRIKCPGCGAVLTVPAGGEYHVKPEPPADKERVATDAPPLPDVRPCPVCAAAMKPDAVVCINCGYSATQGGQLVTEHRTDYRLLVGGAVALIVAALLAVALVFALSGLGSLLGGSGQNQPPPRTLTPPIPDAPAPTERPDTRGVDGANRSPAENRAK